MDLSQLFHEIISKPLHSITIIANLVLIESLLSVDNAAVIAAMVMNLGKKDRKKALSYGLIGAYIFRGACLLTAVYLIKIWWLKPLGGLYLFYLFLKYFIDRSKNQKEKKVDSKKESWLYSKMVGMVGPLWATVISVEIMDLVFSIDNVFAAVAFTDNIILVWLGVFIGILAMRLVARSFVVLMERFPFLEISAFVVLGLLGLKLTLDVSEHFDKESALSKFMESNLVHWGTSGLTIAVFFIPLLTSVLFNFPKKHAKDELNKSIMEK